MKFGKQTVRIENWVKERKMQSDQTNEEQEMKRRVKPKNTVKMTDIYMREWEKG